jgi:hypothetical protein
MKSGERMLDECKELYRRGLTHEQMMAKGYPQRIVTLAIKRVDNMFRLPNEGDPKKRCKRCGKLAFAVYVQGGICKACQIRDQVNEERKGQFQV